jgi:hypothetical protein
LLGEAGLAPAAAEVQFQGCGASSCCNAKGCSSSKGSYACSIDLQVDCSSSVAGAASSCCCATSNQANCTCNCSKPEAAAAAAAAVGWRQQACGGRLSLVLWNDGHELAARGFVDALSFGGGFKEA